MIVALIPLSLVRTSMQAAPSTGGGGVLSVVGQYGIGHGRSGGTPLEWRACIPADAETHPAIVVIHGGNFYSGDFLSNDTQADQDLVCAGFCVFDIEYRLAPPGKIQGQGRDPGRYPSQTDDVATAIRAARNP